MAEVIAQRVMPEMKENHSADPTVWQTMNNPVTAGQAQHSLALKGLNKKKLQNFADQMIMCRVKEVLAYSAETMANVK